MLLPQSSAFAALKNRLNSVSNIGFLQGGPRRYASGTVDPAHRSGLNHYSSSTATGAGAGAGAGTNFDRASGTRLKRDESHIIKWTELLDKFKSVQERARRTQASQRHSLDPDALQSPSLSAAFSAATTDRTRDRAGLPDVPRAGLVNPGGVGVGLGVSGSNVGGSGRGLVDPKAGSSSSLLGSTSKHKSSLPNLGRLGIGGRKSKK